jgi:hypothetical protein
VGDAVAVGVDARIVVEVGLLIGAAASVISCATCVPVEGVTVTIATATVERLEASTKRPNSNGMSNKIR